MRALPLSSLLLAGALVGGCSSEAEGPPALPSASASATPSASPTVVAVPTPAQASTPQGAAAFARFFYAEVQRAFAEKDPAIIDRLAAPGCETCDLFVASLTKLRDNDERATDVRYDIVGAEAPQLDGNEARVTVIYDSPAIQRFDRAGKIISEEPAVRGFEEQMTLVRGAEGWLVKATQAV